jgi:hypothetical protein
MRRLVNTGGLKHWRHSCLPRWLSELWIVSNDIILHQCTLCRRWPRERGHARWFWQPSKVQAIERSGAQLRYLPPYSPDREGLRQAQGLSQGSARPHARRPLESHRQCYPALQSNGVPKLLQGLRL